MPVTARITINSIVPHNGNSALGTASVTESLTTGKDGTAVSKFVSDGKRATAWVHVDGAAFVAIGEDPKTAPLAKADHLRPVHFLPAGSVRQFHLNPGSRVAIEAA